METHKAQMSAGEQEQPVAELVNPRGHHRAVVICEHASNAVPEEFGDLGLSKEDLESHIAWDPGAGQTAILLSGQLDAPLIASRVSRLVYDCNRPPDSPSAMRETSERYAIPGNRALSDARKQERVARYYTPFESLVSETLDEHGPDSVLVTIHSFTPVYFDEARTVEIGLLYDADSRLAEAMLSVSGGFDIRLNEPYGPEDGVTHTLRRHALPRRMLNVMIEIRNDLLATPRQCREMAEHLAHWLEDALAALSGDRPQALAR